MKIALALPCAVLVTAALAVPVAPAGGGVTAPSTSASPTAPTAPTAPAQRADAPSRSARDVPDAQVLVISLDALNPGALRRLGRAGVPHLWRLFDEGAGTFNARTQRELTLTLPNHTSMVTGRRIRASAGGHGVTWNDDEPGHPTTVQAAAGEDVASLFSVAHDAGLTTALFSTKTKLALFRESWPDSLDRTTIKEEQDGRLVAAVRRDLVEQDRAITFVHLGQADHAGHELGFMGPRYLRKVRRLDRLVGSILSEADTRPELDDLTIVLTSDHGGLPGSTSHSARGELANYRVPFVVWGPGIEPADLYDLNPGYRDPGRTRTILKRRQPVRNGDVANLVLGRLGLDPVPGSRFGTTRPLRVTAGG